MVQSFGPAAVAAAVTGTGPAGWLSLALLFMSIGIATPLLAAWGRRNRALVISEPS